MAGSNATSAKASGVEDDASSQTSAREQSDPLVRTAFSGYRSSTIKWHWRTNAEIEAIEAGIYEFVEEQHPVAVRQTYDQATSVRQIFGAQLVAARP